MLRSVASRRFFYVSNIFPFWTPRLSYRAVGAITAAIDVTVIIAANILGQNLCSLVVGKGLVEADTAGVGVLSSLIYFALAQTKGLYRLAALTSSWRSLSRIIGYSILVSFALTTILFLLKAGADFSLTALAISAVLQIGGLAMARIAYSISLRTMIARRQIAGQPVILLGDCAEMVHLKSLYLLLHFGVQDVARVSISGETAEDHSSIATAVTLARDLNAEAFVIASRWETSERLAAISTCLRVSPLPVSLLPDQNIRSVMGQQSSIGKSSSSAIELQRAPMTMTELAIKRSIDILLSSFALLFFLPVIVLTTIAVRLDSHGPIIFKQRRNGFNERQFLIFKFRTMTVLEDGTKVVQARQNDTRITRVGRLLRRSSIDELPQLLNVLKGDMSLVGPRPHALAHDDEYKSQIETYCMRHHVKPGITGWAQIHGLRGETPRVEQMQSRVELDLWYINNWSLPLDIFILIRTCFEVLKHDAY